MQEQQRLEIDIADLYALIGQLTVENRVLRARLAAAAAAAVALDNSDGGAAPGDVGAADIRGAVVPEGGDGRYSAPPVWRHLEPAAAP